MDEFIGSGRPLTNQTFDSLVSTTTLQPMSLWTVLGVESSGYGYLQSLKPKILFEKHIFRRLTNGKYDSDPDISGAYDPNGYGPGGDHQYERLSKAIALDRSAALQSASWGLAQILGENAVAAGYPGVEPFVSAMVASEDNQLAAMVQFLRSTGAMKLLLQSDWDDFALSYNGPAAIKNGYPDRLRQALDRLRKIGIPDLRTRAAQAYLTLKGYTPGPIDGYLGIRTMAAVISYQAATGRLQTGTIDDTLLTALSA